MYCTCVAHDSSLVQHRNISFALSDAFQLGAEVSKAFSCLTDPQKRAYYDRTGHEDRNAHSAAHAARNGANGMYAGDIDPQDLFNAMFGGAGFGMGPVHFGGFGGQRQRAPFAYQRREQGQQQSPAAGPVPSGVSGIVGAFSRMNMVQKMMLLGTAFQLLPVLLAFVGWVWWAALIGVPLWAVSREVMKFEQRRVYRLLQGIEPVRNTVHSVKPYADSYLRLTAPVAAAVASAGRIFLQYAREMANV